jgi:Zn-dependent M28 family amino/carboxypeptidase
METIVTKPLLTGSLLLAASTLALTAGQARAQACDDPLTVEGITECVTLDALVGHLEAFQAIADANGDTRVSGTPGYDASVAYVVEELEAAGVEVELQSFEFTTFTNLGNSLLAQRAAPDPRIYEEGVEYALLSQTDAGSVYAPVSSVTPELGPDNASTDGCEAEDYAGFPEGHIALVQRGTCTFQIKAENAADAGAVGVVVFNQGNTPDRTDVINATLSAEYAGGIPAVFVSYDLGVEFLNTEDLRLRLRTDAFRNTSTTENVIATIPGENPDNIVTVGGDLDSVEEGPGISDNATGVAAVLETAVQMAGTTYPNTLRFFFWGAEEFGLIGAEEYVASLTEEELAQIALYLNFDMIGSPNWVYGIYDGDDSAEEGAGPGPEGSAQIEAAFEEYFASEGVPFTDTDFSGRSDYAPFIAVGIPAGGLFTGADGIKTAEEVAIYGGTEGDPYDPAYHTPADDIDNVAIEPLGVNGDAVAAVTLRYALSTFEVNGVGDEGITLVGGISATAAGITGGLVGAVETEMLGEAYRK